MKRLGFIGVGNMGGAILSGALSHGVLKASEIIVSAKTKKTLDALAATHSDLTCTLDNRQVARESEMILLAVKPQYLHEVLADIHDELRGKAVLSIAAGWTMQMLQAEMAESGIELLRAMPNTPVKTGEGMTAICAENTFTKPHFDFVMQLFSAVGRVAVVPEKLFDGVIAVSGSSPAYLYMMLEAMGDAAVREGLPRKIAYEMAAQSMIGAAKMLLETGEHPGMLKDAVCSPAGTTIEAVASLEKSGFRSAVMEAMAVCAEKSRQMAK